MAKRKSKSDVLKKRSKKKEISLVRFLFKWFFILFIFLILLGCAGLAGLYYYLSQDLPKINTLNDYRPATVTSVFSDDGRKIGEFYEERRIVIPFLKCRITLSMLLFLLKIQGSGNTPVLIFFP